MGAFRNCGENGTRYTLDYHDCTRNENRASMLPVPSVPTSRFARVFDAVLLALVLGLALLVSSFVARNSDVWSHLAMGRLIAGGQYDFAGDPLSYSTEGLRWANHAWLTEWGSYQLFKLGGGAGLVWAKAILVIGIVGIGASGIRRDRPMWLAALLLAVAVVALSPRATLQPMIVTCMLFAALLRLLQVGGRAYSLVPALAVLWVNLDGWFVLAPLAVGLYWLADRWSASRRVPLWLPLATSGACLVSPFHVRASALPAELSPTFLASELASDPRVAIQFASYFTHPRDHLDNASFWAFCALVAGGTALLIARRRQALLWEVAIWFITVGLTAWQARLVPLCAVAAIVLLTPHAQTITPARRWSRGGPWAALALVLAFGLAAWSGWLHGGRGRDRVLGWSVHADPSIVWAGETLATWRRDGSLTADQRVLTTSPDATNTLAWFAPGERGDLDTRWELHARAGRKYPSNLADIAGVDRLKNRNIVAVLLADPTPQSLAAISAPDSAWRVLKVDGRAIWLALKPARNEGAFEPWPASDLLRFDASLLAFGSGAEGAPRPERLPQDRAWWKPPITPRWDRDADGASATTFLNWQLAANASDPALPWLAVRTARRAVAADPDDGQAWLALAKSYAVLGATAENRAASGSGLLTELRRVQRITALTQATIANPDSEAAREGLASTLSEVGYLDRALVERRRQKTLLKRRGDAERLASVTAQIVKLEDDLFDRECSFHVQTAKLSGDPLGRARIALSLGLANVALDTLLKSSPDLYREEGVRLLAALLVSTGQAAEAETLLNRKELLANPGSLGYHEVPSLTETGRRIVYRLPASDWFRFLLAASTGLSDARIPLDNLRGNLTAELGGVGAYRNRIASPVSKQVAADIGLGASGSLLPRVVIDQQREELARPVTQARFLIAERADLTVLDGLCELEAGRTAVALREFRAALADYAGVADLHAAPAKPLAELYRRELERAAR